MLLPDIDTDQIIPAQHVTARSDEELSHALFRNRRDHDPDFVLNDPRMARRTVILAGDNFGCGSSREAAVWALRAGGFKAVLSTGFGDIFRTNCLKNAILPVILTADLHHRLVDALDEDPDLEVELDLKADAIRVPLLPVQDRLNVDEFGRHLLLEGISELDFLLDRLVQVRDYESGPQLHSAIARRLRSENGHREAPSD